MDEEEICLLYYLRRPRWAKLIFLITSVFLNTVSLILVGIPM